MFSGGCPTMKKSADDFKSIFTINFFVDWAIKKKHVALVELESSDGFKSALEINSGSAEETEPKSTHGVKSSVFLKFGSVGELLDL